MFMKQIYNKYIRRGMLVVLDAIFVVCSYIAASIFLNKGLVINKEIFTTILMMSGVYIFMFLLFRIYRSITEYTGAREYAHYMLISMFSCLIIEIASGVTNYKVIGIRTNVLAMCLTVGFMVISRVEIRFCLALITKIKKQKGSIEKVLVVGAGDAGLQVIRDVFPKLENNYKVVGLIDDNKSKINSSIYGIKILGNRDKITEICEKENVDLIFFAIANIPKDEKTKILNICSKTKARIKVIPDMKELLSSNVSIKMKNFRDIQIEDLIGREPVKLENDIIRQFIKDKVVVVTGGGGSIGSELCRQIASFGVKELLMVDIYENTLYETELEIRKKYPELKLTAIIASVRDSKRIKEIFKKYKPELVFHAAAHKHVPLMEISPIEAIKNNVFGTYNVARAASINKVDKFILVSTDKAVNPTSIMGATKRICEMIIQMQNAKSKTNYVAVRFGNVLGSHGSVIPIFKKQIAEGGPVTVTHKDITRFFMTIPEAVGLILQSITFAEGGEIFVLDMGKPVKIYDLAEKMIRLSGYEPNVDMKIQVTGLRPGEKLYEELLISEEGLSKTLHEKIMVTKIMDFDEKRVYKDLSVLRKLVFAKNEVDNEDVKKIIKKIVPSYIYNPVNTQKKITNNENEDTISYVVTLNKKTGKRKIEKALKTAK